MNVEGRRTNAYGVPSPDTNVFLRADTGAIGKFRFGLYGGKRDIMPIYSAAEHPVASPFFGMTADGTRTALRFFGTIKNLGAMGSYDIDTRNRISFNIDKTDEDMKRIVDRGMQVRYGRNLARNTYGLTYTGERGNSDWKVSFDYAKLKEDDITLSSFLGPSMYFGTNTLESVDNIDHRQWTLKAAANTQVNAKHLLTYGFGYTRETGEGSRLKSAPHTRTRRIDPWDYDKSLYTENGGTGAPSSHVHDHAIRYNEQGIPQYDKELEYYGRGTNGRVEVPEYTYEDGQKWGFNYWTLPADMPAEKRAAYWALNRRLCLENGEDPDTYQIGVAKYYAPYNPSMAWTLNGKKFREMYNERQNVVRIGDATITRQNYFVQDTWQINPNTILEPILRVDHSSLFGTNMTFNLGMTYSIGGNAHRRFKANIGTGYTEPGMGELYYNWEMYGGHPIDMYESRLGFYWIGNPYLKPEKSVSFDLGYEIETGRTALRVNLFHNRIRNYMTRYFTGYLMDLHPDDIYQWLAPPDMIYSFRNIGRAEITGLETEVRHTFSEHWSARLGYTLLHAINKSDPLLPRRLLDRPRHKIDIGVNYANPKGKWRAALWSDYYINMLDSNTLDKNGNRVAFPLDPNTGKPKAEYRFAEGKPQTYAKKSFGIWNLLVQRSLGRRDDLLRHRQSLQPARRRPRARRAHLSARREPALRSRWEYRAAVKDRGGHRNGRTGHHDAALHPPSVCSHGR